MDNARMGRNIYFCKKESAHMNNFKFFLYICIVKRATVRHTY